MLTIFLIRLNYMKILEFMESTPEFNLNVFYPKLVNVST